MNLFNKASVISLLVLTLIALSAVVKQVNTAHVSIEVIEESDDPDSSVPKEQVSTDISNTTSVPSDISTTTSPGKNKSSDDPVVTGGTASTISPNDTMLADESVASPVSIAIASTPDGGDREAAISAGSYHKISQNYPPHRGSKRTGDLLLESAAESAIAQLQLEAESKQPFAFGFPLSEFTPGPTSHGQGLHLLPTGNIMTIDSLTAAESASLPGPSASSGGSFFSSLFSKSTPQAASPGTLMANDEESRLKSFLTASRFPFSGFLRGNKEIKQQQQQQQQANQPQGLNSQQQLIQGPSVVDSIVADASSISSSTTSLVNNGHVNGNSGVGSGSNIAVVDQTQFDPVQVELGLSAYPGGESVSPSDLITTAQVNLPAADSTASITPPAASLGHQSFTSQSTSSSSPSPSSSSSASSTSTSSSSYTGFLGKYRSRLPRIRINPFKSGGLFKGDKGKGNTEQLGQTAAVNVNVASASVADSAANSNTSPLGPGPLSYFKNSQPLLSASKLTPKLPSLFLFPIKLFSSATKPLNLLWARTKKVKGKGIFGKSRQPQGPESTILPLANQAGEQFVVIQEQSNADGQGQGPPVYLFVPKNQPIEAAHHAFVEAASSGLSPAVNGPAGGEFLGGKDNINQSDLQLSSTGKDAIGAEEQKNRIPFKSHLHFIEGQEPDDSNYPKDQEPILPVEPEAQASDGSKVHHLPQGEQSSQQHVFIPSDLHEKIQQIQGSLPQNVKEQLHAFAAKLMSNPPSGNKAPIIPPALAAIAAQLTPEQIKSLAGVFLDVQKQHHPLQHQQVQQQQQQHHQPQPIVPSSQPIQPQPGFQVPNYSPKPIAQAPQQPKPASVPFRHRFHFRNPFKSSPPSQSGPLEESRNVPFLFFGDGNQGVSSFFRRPRLIPTTAHLHPETEVNAGPSVVANEPNGPEIQFIPLDGRPNGSPHMDQIEQMLTAALRPDASPAAAGASDGSSQPMVHLNSQHENPSSGQYTVVPVGVPIASAHPSLLPSIGETFLPGLPLNHNPHEAAALLFGQNPSLVHQPGHHHKLRPHHHSPHRRPGHGLPKLVNPPKLGSAYSNGWIPKDLPHDWSPGPIRSPNPTSSSSGEFDAFTKFTAADSITPKPPISFSSSRFTPPGQALKPLNPTTPNPVTPSSTTVASIASSSPSSAEKSIEVDEIIVEEAKHEDSRAKIDPSKDKKKEFKQQEVPRKKNATDSIKLTGKQQLIKLWLSQTPTPLEVSSTVATVTQAPSSFVNGRQGKSLKESIKPSVTVSVSASLNPPLERAHSPIPPPTAKSVVKTTTVPVAAASTIAAATMAPTAAPVATTTVAVATAAASTTTSAPATTSVASGSVVAATSTTEAPFRPSVPRYTAERITKSTTVVPSSTSSAILAVASNENASIVKMEPISQVAKEGILETIGNNNSSVNSRGPGGEASTVKISDKDDLTKLWTGNGKGSTDQHPVVSSSSSSTSPEPVYLSH